MTRKMLVLLGAAALPLAGCTSMDSDRSLAYAGTGAAVGAAGGAGIAAVTGGDLLTGAVIGAAVGGLAGAVWADRDNDGRTDGYVRDGQYYAGAPTAYDTTATGANRCRSVVGTAATGAGVGAGAGAGVGAIASGVGILEGALIGAAVGGIAGAVWADANNDGCADGYMREGRYYEGAPVVQPLPSNYRTGERG
ncbi:MAG: hypothetical protein ACREBO_00500 [Novosphingobium sp.]